MNKHISFRIGFGSTLVSGWLPVGLCTVAKLWLMLCLTVIIEPAAPGATYYVSTGGDNSNPGTEERPWLTVQKSADTASPGDVVIVKPGNYPEWVSTRRDGNPEANITFQGVESPLLSGFNVRNANISLRGFRFDGVSAGVAAVFFTDAAHDCEVSENQFVSAPENKGQVGMATTYPGAKPININIRNNRFLNARYYAVNLQGKGHVLTGNFFSTPFGADAIYLHSSDTLIKGNRFEEWSRPADSTLHTDLFQAFGHNGEISKNNIIEANIAINCKGTQIGNVQDNKANGNVSGWTWLNNVFCNVEAAMSTYSPEQRWFNNVFYRCGTNSAGPLLFRNDAVPTRGTSANCELYNNIFSECGTNAGDARFGWYSTAGLVENFNADYNLVVGSGSGKTKKDFTSGGREAHGVNGLDPLFIDSNAFDFRIREGSPCIDTGKSLRAEYSRDLADSPRGVKWDIGAYEFKPVRPQPPGSLRVVPSSVR